MTPPKAQWNDIMVRSAQIALGTMAVLILVGLIRRKAFNRPLRVMLFFWILTFGLNLFEQGVIWAINTYTDFFQPLLEYLRIDNTFFLTILYYLKNFLVLSLFYSLIFPVSPLDRYILWAGRLLALAALVNYLFIEGFRDFGLFNPGADSIFIVVLPLLYLWVSQRQSLRIPLRKNPYFWISLGLVIPNLLALFLYFTGNYLYTSDLVLYFKFVVVKNAFEIIGQALVAVGFLRARFARFVQIPEGQATNIGS